MIRPALVTALLIAGVSGGLPRPAGACSIQGKLIPADAAARCREHQRRFNGAVAVAQVEVGDFDLVADATDPAVSVGTAPVRVIKVLRGALDQGTYGYRLVSDMGDGVVCPLSNVPDRGRQIAYFYDDRPTLAADALDLDSQESFDREVASCTTPP